MPEHRVLAVIVNYNGGHWVEQAVESLLAQTYPTDVTVMDNQSTDGSPDRLRERFPQIAVIDSGGNVGVAKANNAVLEHPEYDYYLLFNPDALADPGAVRDLVSMMERHPRLGGLGATLIDYHDPSLIQHFQPRLDFLCFPVDRWEGRPVSSLPDLELADVGYLCTATAIFRAEAYRGVGGMDSDFFLFTDDTDLSWRMRLKGWDIAATPQVRVRHVGGASAQYGRHDGQYETSEMRLHLRERNCFFMALKCYAWWTLAPYAVINVLSMLAESAMLRLMGKREMARINIHALCDVFRSLPVMLERRKEVQRSRRISEFRILRSLYWGVGKLWKLQRDGIPTIRTSKTA